MNNNKHHRPANYKYYIVNLLEINSYCRKFFAAVELQAASRLSSVRV